MSARERLAWQLKSRRTAKELSQEAFADLVQLHRTYIGSIERCERNVGIDNIEKIAKALGAEVQEMLEPPSGP